MANACDIIHYQTHCGLVTPMIRVNIGSSNGWCRQAINYYLNLCWLFICEVLRHSLESNFMKSASTNSLSLQRRHNARDGVSDHRGLDYLHNRLFRRRSNKTPKFRVTGFCEGDSPVASEFPAQRANNAVKVSIWWRHHGTCIMSLKIIRSKLLPHI